MAVQFWLHRAGTLRDPQHLVQAAPSLHQRVLLFTQAAMAEPPRADQMEAAVVAVAVQVANRALGHKEEQAAME